MLGFLSGLDLYRPYACCHSFCEFRCASILLHLENALIIFPLLLHEFQSPWGEEHDEDILFKIECFKVSHLLYIAYSWVSVSSHQLQEASLTRAEWDIDLWYSSMSLLVIFLLCSFSRMIVVGFPPDLFLSFKSNFLKIRAQVLFQICTLGISPPHL